VTISSESQPSSQQPLAVSIDSTLDKCSISRRHLTLAAGITLDEAIALIRGLTEMHDASPFLVGDALNQAEARWGDDIYQYASEQLARKHQTFLNWKSVCARVAPHVRNDEVDFTKHAIVAPLPEDRQIYWLQQCLETEMTSKELYNATEEERAAVSASSPRWAKYRKHQAKPETQDPPAPSHKLAPPNSQNGTETTESTHASNGTVPAEFSGLDDLLIGIYIGTVLAQTGKTNDKV
jgi:hypothetical protein